MSCMYVLHRGGREGFLETCSRILTGDEHNREHQQVADLPELNENKEKGLGNLKLPALLVARFTNACTHT